MNNDNKIYKAERRAKTLRCDRCPPHRKENIERTARRSWKFRSKNLANSARSLWLMVNKSMVGCHMYNSNFGNEFDREFDRIHKTARRGFWAILAIWVAWVLFCLAMLAGVVYVAFHFISKLW